MNQQGVTPYYKAVAKHFSVDTSPSRRLCFVSSLDYVMDGGVLRMKLRAATTGSILCQWCVDCSPNQSLRGSEYRLWLKDHLALYGVKNAVLAPGYSATAKVNS